MPEGQQTGLGGTVRDQDVIRRGPGIQRGNRGTELWSAVPLRVRERMIQEPIDGRLLPKQLPKWERLHAALREVEFHAVLPRGLPSLHLERDELHPLGGGIDGGSD